MEAIRVAIAGVGSCASSIIQLAASARRGGELPGVARPVLGGYGVGDIEFVAAFDVDRRKVGLDLRDAALACGNAASTFVDVPEQGVRVQAGPLADGLEGRLERVIEAHPDALVAGPEEVAAELRRCDADLLLCFIPSGSTRAVRMYAQAAAAAGVAFINATPELVARDPYFQELFHDSKSQLLGDDIKSMMGATTIHSALIELLQSKGIEVTGTYQINVGGNSDFLNLSDAQRSASKVSSKRTALAGAGIDAEQVLAGPNGFVDYLGDTKVCLINLVGRNVLGSPISIDLRLQVEDSPNAAGTMIDAVRIAKLARQNGVYGVVAQPCAMLFKSPPHPVSNSESVRDFESFIADMTSGTITH